MEINNLTNEQLEKIKCSVYPTIERWKRYKDTTYYVSTFGKIINTVDTHHNPTITKPLKPYYDKCGYRILNLHKPENHKLLVLSNQKYNNYLKELGAICHIDKSLHSHIARHSAACMMLNKKVSIEVVSKVLGHSSIKMTEHYAKLVDNTISNQVFEAFK